jgi:hypothetical protein
LEETDMTLSAKWTAVSFFALTGIAAGSFAFAGCTVTSGNPTTGDEGGTPIGTDSSVTPTDGGDAGEAVCQGSKQTSGDFFSHTCQVKLNSVCCPELKSCFDLVPEADDAGTTGQDCNAYAKCIDLCTRMADGTTPETDPAKVSACDDDCDALTGKNVIDGYQAIVDCATAKAATECQ